MIQDLTEINKLNRLIIGARVTADAGIWKLKKKIALKKKIQHGYLLVKKSSIENWIIDLTKALLMKAAKPIKAASYAAVVAGLTCWR